MDHPNDSTRVPEGAARALVAALLTCAAMLAVAPAALAEPAIDEYKLDLPGSERASIADLESTQTVRDRGRPLGVIAEDAPAQGPLAATGSMLTSVPPLLIAALAALSGFALWLRFRGARS